MGKGLLVTILGDGMIRQLASTASLVSEFPFLGLTTREPVKACCGRKATTKETPAFQKIKAGIASLPLTGQKTVLAALGLPKARVIYRSGTSIIDVIIG